MKDEIVFFIDKEKFTTDDKTQTAAQLLKLAKEDPAETTLVLKKGNDLTKFKDEDIVTIKNGMHFVVFHDGPTPVSYFGPERFVGELIELGYKPELIAASDNNKYAILRDYEVLLGKFIGRKIDLGMLATNDFPVSVTSAIHVRANPQLFEKQDTVTNVRNITDSVLGSEWRYWSINFNWKKGYSTRRLMSKINTVFQNA
ncbi:MAG: multiubiquitin domain-containing protein [Gammaproteobacteria bacterium]|nr:multiubiquitin domain-containing protein [Gammaproteobacteria bacterium]